MGELNDVQRDKWGYLVTLKPLALIVCVQFKAATNDYFFD